MKESRETGRRKRERERERQRERERERAFLSVSSSLFHRDQIKDETMETDTGWLEAES